MRFLNSRQTETNASVDWVFGWEIMILQWDENIRDGLAGIAIGRHMETRDRRGREIESDREIERHRETESGRRTERDRETVIETVTERQKVTER